MEVTGESFIKAPPALVWASLHDARCLAATLPACHRVSGSPDEGFEVEFGGTFGHIPAKLKTRLTIEVLTENSACRISAEGEGFLTGGIGGQVEMTLSPAGAGTRLDYTAAPRAGGKFLKLIGLPLDKVTERMASRFLRSLKVYVEADARRK